MSDTDIVLVTWKDEGDFGFINTFTQADEDYRKANPKSLGVPFDPNRVRRTGTRREAELYAKQLGARFEES